jgi:hypothetical protein
VIYLPESNEPPDLVCVPMAMLTGAILPLAVLPELAPSSIISLARILSLQIFFKKWNSSRKSLLPIQIPALIPQP